MLLTSSPWLHERSRTSVQEYLKHDDLILVPIGATEQHGRHTPLMVDTGWAIAVAEGAALATGTLVAPPQHVGWSPHHLAYCGALTFRPETLISVMVDIGESLIHHGFRKIVFVNGNRIANLPPMEIAAAKLRFSTGAYVSVVDAGLIARREVGEICQAGENGHGGDSETSFMLHWRPDLVDMSQAAPGKPHQTGGSFPTNPMPYQPPFDQNVISVRITAEEMLRGHESGISGDATVADADKGRRVLEAIVRNTARHIEEARRLKPEVRRPPIRSDRRRRHRGALDAVARERVGDEAAGLHALDEISQVALGLGRIALGAAHGLADHHEAARQQAQPGMAGRVGLELLRTPAATSSFCSRKVSTTAGEVGARTISAAFSSRVRYRS